MSTTQPQHTDIAIIGSGFSGLAMAARLKRSGRDDFVILERAREVGGTWRDNTYPGCACDVPSHVYSFSFALNPEWSSTYSPQPEIQAYIRGVAEREGLLPHICFGCEVEDAAWDEDAQRWRIHTSAGEINARALITAAGPLSEPSIPEIEGLRDFKGTVFHSASWDHDHDLAGERVAVVGTGASAIQFVPEIQPEVGALQLYQRTPPWIMPRSARPLSRAEHAVYRRVPGAQRLMRNAVLWARELFAVPMLRMAFSPILRAIGRAHMRNQISDPALREKLIPDYAPGCKRILISNDYLPSLGEDNVEVVTDGIAEIRERSIVDADGVERDVDTIIFGTGFHVTDLPIAHRIRGREGESLAHRFEATGMRSNRGTTVAGFPNLFFLLGPNTGLGHNSVVQMAEAQAGYVLEALGHLDAHGLGRIEVDPAAEARWSEAMQAKMAGTVWIEGGCSSWYLDSEGRNTTLFPDFSFRFRRALSSFDPGEYRFQPAVEPAPAPVHTEVAT